MAKLTQLLSQLQVERARIAGDLNRLETAISAINGISGNHVTPGSKRGATIRARRPLSAAARKRIATAQKARWAAWRAKQGKKAA